MTNESTPRDLNDDATAHDAVLRELRALLLRGAPLIVVDSPPGAGKSSLVVQAAAACAADGDRVAVMCATNAQALDLAHRLVTDHPALPVTVAVGKDAAVPEPEEKGPRMARGHVPPPAAGSVTVANGAVWTWHGEAADGRAAWDLMIVDEAYQAPWHSFRLAAPLASRHLLVGDPGQIEPFSEVEQERWHGDPLGPLVPAATAALHLRPAAPTLRLPVSWRLPADTTAAIAPACYPNLGFRSSTRAGARQLIPGRVGASIDAVTAPLRSTSLAQWALPGGWSTADPTDPELCDAAVSAVASICDGRTAILDERGCRPLEPERVAVIVARTAQAARVRRLLPTSLGAVAVGTANSVQGLEWDVTVALDPCASAPAGDFVLDPGRLCVQLTRHRIACLWITREHVYDRLKQHIPASARRLRAQDREHDGLTAHLAVRRALAAAGSR